MQHSLVSISSSMACNHPSLESSVGGMGTARKHCHTFHLFHHNTQRSKGLGCSQVNRKLQKDLAKGSEQHLSPSTLSKRCPSFPWVLSQILPNSSFIWLSQARCKPQVPLLPLIPSALFLSTHLSPKLSFSSLPDTEFWLGDVQASLPVSLLHVLPMVM